MKRLFAVVVLCAVAGCGGGDDDAEPKREPAPKGRVDRAFGAAVPGSRGRVRFIAPRWERVAEFSGDGGATESFDIKPDAIQWRARWRCEGDGEFELELPARPGQPGRAGGDCPTSGIGAAIKTGKVQLRVKADTDWTLTIEQQLHDVVRDPVPPEVANGAARAHGRGAFYPMEQQGQGTAALYELPNGRLLLRFEGFRTLATTGLFIWVSDDPRPRTSKEAVQSHHRKVGELKSTAGEQNYLLPRGLRPDKVRSIIIWCEPLRMAYLGAELRRS